MIKPIAAVICCALLPFVSLAQSASSPSLSFERCQISLGAVAVDAECASFSRPENPDDVDGKQIELQVVKLPADTTQPEADAFTLIQGGPGGSSIDMGIQFRGLLGQIRKTRDVLLIDQRGTGRSNPLFCDQIAPEKQLDVSEAAIKEATQACLDQLNEKADLAYYTTSVAVSDLDAMREAAGYAQLSVYGASYGTRVAQHYLRRYPDNTRLLILDGVVPIGLNLAGTEIARRSQEALESIALRCREDANCTAAFGDVLQNFDTVRERIKSEAITVQVAHPFTGNLVQKTLSEFDLLVPVRMMPYATETLSLLPLMLAQAVTGDYRLLAGQSLMLEELFAQDMATGMHNSVMCTEDERFVDYQNQPSADDTYFGNIMSEAMRHTCDLWPEGRMDVDFRTPFESDTPVLILSGATDPITPPTNGEQAAAMFSNSKHLVVPAHGHAVYPRGCVPFLVNDFMQTANLQSLNAACVEREQAVPFFVNSNGPTP